MIHKYAITFFSEDRLATNAEGQAISPDADLARDGWARGLPQRDMACFAARLDRRGMGNGYAVAGAVFGLPYYQGGVGLLRKAPSLAYSVWRSVRRSTVIAVRLPGIIGLIAVAAAVLLRRTVVIELVGDVHEVLQTGVGGRIGRALAAPASAATRWAVRRGDVVRYVTQSRLQAVYPAADSARVLAFSDVRLDARDFADPAVDLNPTPRIIAIGSQEQMYKGHDLLITAVSDLRGSGHDVDLVLLGTGRCQQELRARARDLGVESHVRFLGHVSSRTAVRDELDRSWIYAMPSRTEGLPRALVEAMARAKPCVVSDVGGMPELVDELSVVPPNDVSELCDAISRLLGSAEKREAQGAANRSRVVKLAETWSAEREVWESTLAGFGRHSERPGAARPDGAA